MLSHNFVLWCTAVLGVLVPNAGSSLRGNENTLHELRRLQNTCEASEECKVLAYDCDGCRCIALPKTVDFEQCGECQGEQDPCWSPGKRRTAVCEDNTCKLALAPFGAMGSRGVGGKAGRGKAKPPRSGPKKVGFPRKSPLEKPVSDRPTPISTTTIDVSGCPCNQATFDEEGDFFECIREAAINQTTKEEKSRIWSACLPSVIGENCPCDQARNKTDYMKCMGEKAMGLDGRGRGKLRKQCGLPAILIGGGSRDGLIGGEAELIGIDCPCNDTLAEENYIECIRKESIGRNRRERMQLWNICFLSDMIGEDDCPCDGENMADFNRCMRAQATNTSKGELRKKCGLPSLLMKRERSRVPFDCPCDESLNVTTYVDCVKENAMSLGKKSDKMKLARRCFVPGLIPTDCPCRTSTNMTEYKECMSDETNGLNRTSKMELRLSCGLPGPFAVDAGSFWLRADEADCDSNEDCVAVPSQCKGCYCAAVSVLQKDQLEVCEEEKRCMINPCNVSGIEKKAKCIEGQCYIF